MLRSFSVPARQPAVDGQTAGPVLIRRLRGSDGELCLMGHGRNKWLADYSDTTFQLELPGVNFNDIAEDTLKKGKAWMKLQIKQDKKMSELLKQFTKERQAQVKGQMQQMDNLRRENTAALSKCHDRSEKELLEEHQKRDMKALSALHDHASLQLEKTHKIEEFNCKMNIMRENNEQFIQMKKEAHDLQLVKYEHYLSMEVMDLTKSLQISNSQGIARLMNDVKDKEKLARCIEDFEEKDDADSAIKRKKLVNTQEIRREQLQVEHKEQMKVVDQVYLKESKDLEFSAQKEIGVIEQLISKFEDAHLNYANMETD